ncbi:hypothetical protein [Sinorhizobium meliloti]|uniref:hypothetical protein n=1 Tax=Rhizobium meliloti TaxID=382 RepID=UPI00299F2C25|nr:hypothetical protein [Sinorhizobium meliloti]
MKSPEKDDPTDDPALSYTEPRSYVPEVSRLERFAEIKEAVAGWNEAARGNTPREDTPKGNIQTDVMRIEANQKAVLENIGFENPTEAAAALRDDDTYASFHNKFLSEGYEEGVSFLAEFKALERAKENLLSEPNPSLEPQITPIKIEGPRL